MSMNENNTFIPEHHIIPNSQYRFMRFQEKKFIDNQVSLLVPCSIRIKHDVPSTVVENLGTVRKKNDGRYLWYCSPSRSLSFLKIENKQGVAPTKLAACVKILECLPEGTDISKVVYRSADETEVLFSTLIEKEIEGSHDY